MKKKSQGFDSEVFALCNWNEGGGGASRKASLGKHFGDVGFEIPIISPMEIVE